MIANDASPYTLGVATTNAVNPLTDSVYEDDVAGLAPEADCAVVMVVDPGLFNTTISPYTPATLLLLLEYVNFPVADNENVFNSPFGFE